MNETCPDCGHSSYNDDCPCKCHSKCKEVFNQEEVIYEVQVLSKDV